MHITILTSDTKHPIYPRLQTWAAECKAAEVRIVLRPQEAEGGDYLFLISCKDIVGADIRVRYRHTLVIHASALPKGRGWSPLAWSVLAGASEITVSLINAEDKVDTGAIWAQRCFNLEGHELFPEISQRLFDIEVELMDHAIKCDREIVPEVQPDSGESYYGRRTPKDSRLDPNKTIAEQFDLMRICDDLRYPAFFDYRGHRYELRLTKATDHNTPTAEKSVHENP